MAKTPSTALFQDRLRGMIQARGIESVAKQYGRSEKSVDNWLNSDAKPSVKIQNSVQRIGIQYTGAVVQTFSGQFASDKNITTQNARQAEDAIITRYKDDLEASLRNAQGSKQEAMVQSKIDNLDSYSDDLRERIISLDAKLSRARETDNEDDWSDFRSSYSDM